MGLEALRRAELATLALGVLTGAVVAIIGSPAFGAGIAVGAAWAAANLWALAGLLRQEIRRRNGTASRVSYVAWSAIKFPVLYGGGFLILAKSGLPTESLLIGLAFLFVVWAAEAAWRSFGVPARPASTVTGEDRP
jgi:hypothetical protein